MPIGKNALKRVSNNGYSNVKTTAPDMENSEVDAVQSEKPSSAVKKTGAKKAAPAPKTESKKNSAPKKKPAEKKEPIKKPAANKNTQTVEVDENGSHPDGFVRIAFGEDLPVHLL